jgi:uncharacterized lipoprotein YmbA
MGRIAVVVALALLVGCATPEPKERIVRVPVRVEVPVILPCPVVMPAVPVYEYTLIERGMGAEEVIKHLQIGAMQHRAVEDVLRGLLEKCREQP